MLGDRTQVKQAAAALNVSLEGVRIINPAESEDLAAFIKRYELLRRFKGVEEKEARETMLNPNYYGAMMLAMHQVDGFISGANQSSGSVLRPLFQIVKVAPEATTASSCMVMEVEDTRFGDEGVLFMARLRRHSRTDCRSNWPTLPSRRPHLCRQLLGIRPRVALLSYSTKGSATHASIGKVQAATALAQKLAHEQGLEADFDGELQVDAALIPEIAARKLPESQVAGRANVLIFPDLNAGNIGSKLHPTRRQGPCLRPNPARPGPPAADVSRGSNAHDVLGVAAIVGVQSIAFKDLYPSPLDSRSQTKSAACHADRSRPLNTVTPRVLYCRDPPE